MKYWIFLVFVSSIALASERRIDNQDENGRVIVYLTPNLILNGVSAVDTVSCDTACAAQEDICVTVLKNVDNTKKECTDTAGARSCLCLGD